MSLPPKFDISSAEKKYSKVMYTPHDLPRDETTRDTMLQLWQEHSGLVQLFSICDRCETKTRLETPRLCCLNKHHWSGLTLLGGFGKNPVFTQPKIPDESILKNYFEELTRLGPFECLTHVWLWQSRQEIPPHREFDQTFDMNLPIIIRGILFDENKGKSFYLWTGTEATQITSAAKSKLSADHYKYLDLPSGATYFTWNNSKCLHGSDYNGSNKIIIALSGKHNLEKYNDLMTSSLDKFKDSVEYLAIAE